MGAAGDEADVPSSRLLRGRREPIPRRRHLLHPAVRRLGLLLLPSRPPPPASLPRRQAACCSTLPPPLPSFPSLTLGAGEKAEPLPAAGPRHLLFDHAEEALDLHPCVRAPLGRRRTELGSRFGVWAFRLKRANAQITRPLYGFVHSAGVPFNTEEAQRDTAAACVGSPKRDTAAAVLPAQPLRRRPGPL